MLLAKAFAILISSRHPIRDRTEIHAIEYIKDSRDAIVPASCVVLLHLNQCGRVDEDVSPVRNLAFALDDAVLLC